MKKTIVLGITSGIAAYKSLDLIKILKEENLDVHVVMTEKATHMIALNEFEKVSGNIVHRDLFEDAFDYKTILKLRTVEHISLADQADVLVIAPATANTLAKLAHGLADDFLTTMTLATTAPIILCPSMNVHMWNNPIVQENIIKLKMLGYIIIPPTSGMLACGYEGMGKLVDITVIKDEITKQLSLTKSLHGKTVIVTAGGTIEPIDAVRAITNRSSGKMGVALAEEVYLRGANVVLLRAEKSVKPRYLMQEKTFTTAEELENLITEHIKNADMIIHAAAVSDFTVSQTNGKISSKKIETIQLHPRKKILDSIKKLHPKILLIACKAESGLSEKALIKKSQKRLKESNADVIVANDISKKTQGFESDHNEVTIVAKNGDIQHISLAKKTVVAKQIIDYLVKNFV